MNEAAARILIVDDQPDNLLILEDLLGRHYTVHAACDGEDALTRLADGDRPDLMLLDVVMPGMDGFEVCRRVKASPGLRDMPVLLLTSLDSAADEEYGLSLGADDFIHKPYSPPVVLARVNNHLKLARASRQLRDRNEDLERLVAERTREILRQSEQLIRSKQEVIASQGATITALCSLTEVRDNETGGHIRRTQHYVRVLAERLRDHPRFRHELNDETIDMMFRSAPLHDVGKVAIPDAILLKQGKLTPAEWEIMKRHPTHGRDAIAQAELELGDQGGSFLRFAREIAHCHHEKWDGSGYPQGLAGDDIPISARLMAAADVYDALMSRRTYKEAYSHERAMEMIQAERGRHFDPDVVDALQGLAETCRDIARRYRDGNDPQ
ncbi:HD domain-containing phosphohydrolase [Immundisolibacter sp.]|uniref:HD domain-containing phosphohydrolase n=1 Tax=Immundisolibacter sp. TaxID=1934948 RepID=UPI002B144CA0|nr:HD domain-containing phosphohydrolase [Immundisolibacter sp.]MEA3220593.1 putative cyclic di-GMP phosphodiesterase [Immundisolibacter sp.]